MHDSDMEKGTSFVYVLCQHTHTHTKQPITPAGPYTVDKQHCVCTGIMGGPVFI